MSSPDPSTVHWHPDGYVEVTFVGLQTPDQLRAIDVQTRQILESHGAASLLIDARRGRMERDAASFSVVMRFSRERLLKRFVILVDRVPVGPEAGKESGVIISMLTAALGKRPIYMYNEAEARALAASD